MISQYLRYPRMLHTITILKRNCIWSKISLSIYKKMTFRCVGKTYPTKTCTKQTKKMYIEIAMKE